MDVVINNVQTKKKGNLILYIIILLLIIFGIFFGCFIYFNYFNNRIVPIEKIELEKKEIDLYYGDLYQIKTNIYPINANNVNFQWTSSEPEKVSVDDSGFIYIKNNSTYSVTITVSDLNTDLKQSIKVNVKEVSSIIKVTSINIDKTDLTLKYGESAKINASVVPSNATNKSLIWTSSDSSVVSVDNLGNIKVISNKGSFVVITVKSLEGNFEKKINVNTIKANKVVNTTGIKLDDTRVSLKYGETLKLKASVVPENATNKLITWSSSDNSIVSVDSIGNIKVISNKDSLVVITATTKEGKFKKQVKVKTIKVDKIIDVKEVKIDKSELTIKYGDTAKLKATISPTNATDKSIIWSSSDNSTLSVDQEGNIKAVGNNDAVVNITASSVNGIVAIAKVTVKSVGKIVEGVTLTTNNTAFTVGDKVSIRTSITPNTAITNLNWNSSDYNVASVNGDGLVTFINPGSVTITATSDNNISGRINLTCSNNNYILNGFLRSSGTKIVNGKGNAVTLKGFNLGGWFSRSFSMTYFKDLTTLQRRVENDGFNFSKLISSILDIFNYKLDDSKKDEFLSLGYSCINNEAFYQVLNDNKNNFSNSQIQALSNAYYKNFINEKDFDLIAQTGANVVRLPIEYTYFNLLDGTMANDFSYIDWAIAQAKKRGIYVILDLHLVEGRQNSGGYCSEYTFFENETYMQNALTLWGHIAYRYKDEVAVAGYDVLNEPETSKDKLLNFYKRAYNTIRKYDKNHIIIMEETCVVCGHSAVNNKGIGDLPNPASMGWTNVVYSVHDYPNLDSNANNDDMATLPNVLISRLNSRLSALKQKMTSYNIPYYVGEFSYLGSTTQRANQNARYREYLCVWRYAMNKYDELGVSYTPWTYKANNELYYGLIYYGSKNVNDKADLLNDSYNDLLRKFSYKSNEYMRFNEDFYLMFLNQFGGRIGTKITVTNPNLTLKVGQSSIVNYLVTPNTAINKNVVWSSSDANVATVDPNTGKISAVSRGTAVISVSNNPFVSVIDSNDIYICSEGLMNSFASGGVKNPYQNLNINVSASITVTVK